jgi:hypothetical protein
MKSDEAEVDAILRSHVLTGGGAHPELADDLREILSRFHRGQPVYRQAAAFRERACQPWISGGEVADWYTELWMGDEHFTRMADSYGQDLHSCLAAWVTQKLRSISATSNWIAPSEGLTYKLLATELRGAVVGDLALPMAAFYVELPDDVFWLRDKRTGYHCVRTLVVSRGRVTERTLEIAARQAGHVGALPQGPELGDRLLIEAYGEPNARSTNPFDDTWLFKTYLINRADEQIEDAIARSVRAEDRERRLNDGKLGDRQLDGIEIRDLLIRFVLNLCVYLGTEKATMAHIHAEEIARLHGGKKFRHLRKATQNRINRLRDDRVFAVGTDVTVDTEIREIVRTEGTSGYSLTYRTLVRGHYRNQAHGPGRTLRTRRWIEPHVRGADLPTEVVGHRYKVNERPQDESAGER